MGRSHFGFLAPFSTKESEMKPDFKSRERHCFSALGLLGRDRVTDSSSWALAAQSVK